jgi:mono/diheme cytochrome c family protein
MVPHFKTPLFWLVLCVLLLASALELFAEELAPAPYVDWGKELFQSHCASCHGTDGSGNGPAASALKTAPSDLRRLAKTHGGRFPRSEVVLFIDGETPVSAHGSREMPIWGWVFDGSTPDRMLRPRRTPRSKRSRIF